MVEEALELLLAGLGERVVVAGQVPGDLRAEEPPAFDELADGAGEVLVQLPRPRIFENIPARSCSMALGEPLEPVDDRRSPHSGRGAPRRPRTIVRDDPSSCSADEHREEL